MSGRKVDEKVVSIPEVKDIMEDVKEKIGEIDSDEGMSHFQEITYNYVNKFSKIPTKIAMKIVKFLLEKYDIEDIYAINVVNIDPQSVPELRMIFEKSYNGKTLSDDQLQEILYQIEDIKTT
jgi:DNA-directed RNA polymerase subunit F